jgi:dihydrodipicolinate synthase/N-acetylneuraminate lyase
MKRTPVTAADIARSVLAVPPLARNKDLSLNREANAKLIRHIEAGGVSSLLYGGNANFYNVGLYEYAEILDCLAEAAGSDTWVVPSVGPDFGKMLDQAALLKTRDFPTAMVLPASFPATPDGVESAIRRFVDACGKPAVVYLKDDSYLTPAAVQRLVQADCVAAVKYAIVRDDPTHDPFLAELTELVDRTIVFSGIGERPVVTHLRQFRLGGFTSGSVCVAPRGSTQILSKLKAGDWQAAEALRAHYLPLEGLRDQHSPIRVLHEAITLAGIAEMGPVLPNLSNIDAGVAVEVKQAARELLAWDRGL